MHRQKLLLLSTTPSTPLRSLNTLLIRLDLPARAHKPSRLPRPLQIANRRLPPQMHFRQVALERRLDGDDALDEQRVGVLEVEVHDGHHADAHQLAAPRLAHLRVVVGVDGGGDGLFALGGAHGRWFDVFEDGLVCGSRSVAWTN